jgi:glycosyltransferase involved in cell wall biosynthesis
MISYSIYEFDTRIRREAETLAALQEYEVTVLCLKKTSKPETYEVHGVKVIEINHEKYQGRSNFQYLLSYCMFTFRVFSACNKLFATHKTGILHIHNMPNFLVFAAFVPRLFGSKIILDLHDTVPETYAAKFSMPNGWLAKLLFKILCLEERISCWFADKIICVNHIQCEELVKRSISPKKITVSLNVPDPHWFRQDYKNKTSGDKTNQTFRLVYHGTIVKRFGIDLVIKAVGKISNKIPEIEFYVFGPGDDKSEFIELRNELGLEHHIHFMDRVPLELLSQKLQDMDVGIMGYRKNSATELALPVKLVEYVALGIPVIAPRLKTIEYYFTNEMVTYFEPENIDSLAQAIMDVYCNKERWLKQVHIAQTFFNIYGWEHHKFDFINLYKTLTGEIS